VQAGAPTVLWVAPPLVVTNGAKKRTNAVDANILRKKWEELNELEKTGEVGKIGFEVFTAKNMGTKTFEGLTMLLGEQYG